MIEQFANLAQSTLASNISSGATSLSVVSASSFPTSGNFRIIIDSEIFLVTAVSGTTLTVTPGYEGSTQASHTSGASVCHIMTAGVAGLFVQKNSQGSAVINGLGDSITAGASQVAYQQSGVLNTPAWAASTAYVAGNIVNNNGNIYRCTTGGTSASSGGPSGVTSSISDGTVVWTYSIPTMNKTSCSYLKWAETFSAGRLTFDQNQGYNGALGSIVKGFVINGGSNYTSPSITLNGGAAATLQTSAGVISGITITNPGYPNGPVTYSITDATGSGAVLSFACNPSGTYATTGNRTQDMVAMLPDVVASNADIFVVHGGANDLSNSVSYATITANLRTCYETLVAAGKKIIAMPVLPRTGLNTIQKGTHMRVNRWIRAYCRKELWANPLGITNVVLADPEGFTCDGANANNYPVGGTGGSAYAMSIDGLHPSPRAAMYIGYAVWQAAQQFIGTAPAYPTRAYSSSDGYDIVNNPGGNLLEALPWQASTAYVQNQLCNNNNNIYLCNVSSGTSASSGGPSGTGSSITDGSVTWKYLRPAYMSIFASGTAGTNTAATGITFTGTVASGYQVIRVQGSASGTVNESIETPWSTGQNGQRQVITLSLGGGTSNELWELFVANTGYANFGIPVSDLGTVPYYAECELELSNIANMCSIYAHFLDTNGSFNSYDGFGNNATGYQMMQSNGEMLPIPNNGKLYLRTPPIYLPPNVQNVAFFIRFGFDASGAAGSATATIKFNYTAIRKAGLA